MQAGLAGSTVWLRVHGRGTFQNSTGLKMFAAEMIGRGHREFILDLADCELMDSTFIGTLAGLASRLGSGGVLKVTRANARNLEVLRNLGLDRLLQITDTAPLPPPESELREAPKPAGRQAQRETIIEAHEALVASNPENAVRFRDVLSFLREGGAPPG